MGQYEFERRGMGYVATSEEGAVQLAFSAVKRARGGLSARVKALALTSGIAARPDGFLHDSVANLSALQTRTNLARYLSGRTNGVEIDWREFLERAFLDVIEADAAGSPTEDLDLADLSFVPEIPFLLHGFARRGQVTWLYGPGGTGKTTLLIALALSLASHREIVPGIAPGGKGPVLYLDWETDREQFRARASSIAKAAGVGSVKISYRRCDRPLAEETELIGELIAAKEIVLLVVDSAGLALGHASEYVDQSEPVKEFFRACRFLHTTVLVADHVAKTDRRRTTSATPIGSIYKENLARTTWEIRRLSEEDHAVRVALFLRKANDRGRQDPIAYRLSYGDEGPSFVGESLSEAEARGGTMAQVAAFLAGSGGSTEELISGMLDLSKASVHRALYRLKEKGQVLRTEDGLWHPAQDGKELASSQLEALIQ